jgi:alkylation response protein AidB-like acyl-CoA dehydrogenase
MLVEAWEKQRDSLSPAARQVARDRVTRLWARAEVLRLTSIRAKASQSRGVPGPEGSVGKLASAELNKAIFEEAVALLGADGMLMPAGYPLSRERGGGMYSADSVKSFLRSRANSIEGGTSEVMRNILGERVLGLPGDVRTDKDVPWVDVPRN